MSSSTKTYLNVAANGGRNVDHAPEPTSAQVSDAHSLSIYIANAGLDNGTPDGETKVYDLVAAICCRFGKIHHIDLVGYTDVRSGRPIFAAYVHLVDWVSSPESVQFQKAIKLGKTRLDYTSGGRSRYFVCAANNTRKKTDEEKAAEAAAAALAISLTTQVPIAEGLGSHIDIVAELDDLCYRTEATMDEEHERIENEKWLDHERYKALTNIAFAEEVIQTNMEYIKRLSECF